MNVCIEDVYIIVCWKINLHFNFNTGRFVQDLLKKTCMKKFCRLLELYSWNE
jgi:hypothetical protein